MELDMTSGKPLDTLLKFSLPLLAGSVIQNLYNIFDTAIVGHVLGKYALAAVGNSYVPTLIINSIILGIASGISILTAQLYGSKDKEQIQNCYGSVQMLIVAVGVGLAVLPFIYGLQRLGFRFWQSTIFIRLCSRQKGIPEHRLSVSVCPASLISCSTSCL